MGPREFFRRISKSIEQKSQFFIYRIIIIPDFGEIKFQMTTIILHIFKVGICGRDQFFQPIHSFVLPDSQNCSKLVCSIGATSPVDT